MQQTAFSFCNNNTYNQNEYITSSSNSLAYNTIINWPQNWGVAPYLKTLILKGAQYSGKTFLAKKWASRSGALFIKQQHELTENLLFHHQAFVIDGFNDSWQKEKILHHFNTIHENDKFLLITTTKIPNIELPDLASRINASNVININMPDDELLQMLIFKLFSNFSVVISSEVVSYLIKVLPREFPQIVNSVEKINQYALQQKRKITIPLVKSVIGD